MGKHKKTGKTRLDKWYRLAKEQGLRSRASFKLVQLNRKFDFLSRSQCVVDLCAAPGGWLQIAEKTMPVSKILIGVDLVPIRALRGCITLTEDITTDKCLAAIKKELNDWKVDTVLHDGSPNVGGAWSKDAYGQVELSLQSLKLTTKILRKGGTFVTKVFRSADYNKFLWVCQQFFQRVDATKPAASRSTSAEIYLVCQNYLAPDKIDPRLLNPEVVFADIQTTRNFDVFSKSNQKKNRDGYTGTEYQKGTVIDFLKYDKPQEFLATHAVLLFNDESKEIESHKSTTEDIKYLCGDLKTLAKKDFKLLVKWRKQMLKLLPTPEEEEDEEKEKGEGDKTPESKEIEIPTENKDEDSDDAREKVFDEKMKEYRERLAKQKKKAKRKKHELKMKARRRLIGSGIDGQGLIEDLTEPLFSLKDIKTTQQLDIVADADINQIGEAYESAQKEQDEEARRIEKEANKYLSDSDAEAQYKEEIEDNIDRMYEDYAKRKGHKRRRRNKLINEMPEPSDPNDDLKDIEIASTENEKPSALHVSFEPTPTQRDIAERWFSRPAFANLDLDENKDPSSSSTKTEDEENPKTESESSPSLEEAAQSTLQSSSSADADGNLIPKEESDGEETPKKSPKKSNADDESDDSDVHLPFKKTRKKSSAREREKRLAHEKKGKQQETLEAFEEVPSTTSKTTQNTKLSSTNDTKKQQKSKTKPLTPSTAALGPQGAASGPQGATTGPQGDDVPKPKDKDVSTFEEVPMDEWSTDDEATAEVLAIGTAMLRKKRREQIINNSYNKRSFNDSHNLPEWFVNDERQYNRPNLPITKEEVEAQKKRFREVDARPIKKIVESLARKKLRKAKQVEKLKAEADAIAASKDMSNKEKQFALERLYKKKLKRPRQERFYVVSDKGGLKRSGTKPKGARLKFVDKRMKADRRGMESSQRKQQSKAGGKRGRKRKR